MEGGHVTEAEQIEILYPSGYSKWFKCAYQTQDMLIRYNHSYSWEFCISNQKDKFFLIFIFFIIFFMLNLELKGWKQRFWPLSCILPPYGESLSGNEDTSLKESSNGEISRPNDIVWPTGYSNAKRSLFFAHSVSSWIFWRVKFYKFSCKDGTRINH